MPLFLARGYQPWGESRSFRHLICAGVIPQQPPIILAPAAAQRLAKSAYASGVISWRIGATLHSPHIYHRQAEKRWHKHQSSAGDPQKMSMRNSYGIFHYLWLRTIKQQGVSHLGLKQRQHIAERLS